jgi:hypothetical protein
MITKFSVEETASFFIIPRKLYQRINRTYYSENILNIVSEFWRNMHIPSSITLRRFRGNAPQLQNKLTNIPKFRMNIMSLSHLENCNPFRRTTPSLSLFFFVEADSMASQSKRQHETSVWWKYSIFVLQKRWYYESKKAYHWILLSYKRRDTNTEFWESVWGCSDYATTRMLRAWSRTGGGKFMFFEFRDACTKTSEPSTGNALYTCTLYAREQRLNIISVIGHRPPAVCWREMHMPR